METINTPPETGNLLDGLEQAMPLDVDREIDEVSGRQKEQYDHVGKDAEELIDTDPPAETGEGGVPMGTMARNKAARALMLMLDRAQAGIFTLFGARGHADDFRFNTTDRAEMAGYLEQGLPENFRMPWYVPFLLLLVTQLAMNWTKLQDIKEAKRGEEEAARNKAIAEERARAESEEEAVLRDRFTAKRESRQAAKGAVPADGTAAENDGAPLCPECKINELAKGRMYCSPSCRSKANGRKRKAA